MNLVEADTRICVLMADDDVELAREVTDYIGRYGFRGVVAATWEEATRVVERERPRAIILDQWLGPIDTIPRVPELRRLTAAPILILTANREEADRVVGLELGADDFLNKPISGRELVARLRTRLRAALPAEGARWRLDKSSQRLLRADGQSIHLTTAEFATLAELIERPGEIYTRDTLSLAVFKRAWQPGDRAVDTIVAKLRAKLDGGRTSDDGPSCITTVRPTGYCFVRFPD